MQVHVTWQHWMRTTEHPKKQQSSTGRNRKTLSYKYLQQRRGGEGRIFLCQWPCSLEVVWQGPRNRDGWGKSLCWVGWEPTINKPTHFFLLFPPLSFLYAPQHFWSWCLNWYLRGGGFQCETEDHSKYSIDSSKEVISDQSRGHSFGLLRFLWGFVLNIKFCLFAALNSISARL